MLRAARERGKGSDSESEEVAWIHARRQYEMSPLDDPDSRESDSGRKTR